MHSAKRSTAKVGSSSQSAPPLTRASRHTASATSVPPSPWSFRHRPWLPVPYWLHLTHSQQRVLCVASPPLLQTPTPKPTIERPLLNPLISYQQLPTAPQPRVNVLFNATPPIRPVICPPLPIPVAGTFRSQAGIFEPEPEPEPEPLPKPPAPYHAIAALRLVSHTYSSPGASLYRSYTVWYRRLKST